MSAPTPHARAHSPAHPFAHTLALARSLLFVPGNRPERFAKALASGADTVIIDFEDAVAPADKLAARQMLEASWDDFSAAERSRIALRINAAGTPWHEDDLLFLAGLGVLGVVLPKAESASQLAHAAELLGPSCVLVPLIESVAGLDALDALARSPQVVRLAFGNLDFQADVAMACSIDESELAPVRLGLVLASRRAELPAPIDGVTASLKDAAQLAFDAGRSRRMGFGAKLCIHPSQVAPVNTAFGVAAAELDWAQRVMKAFDAAGGGVASLDGRMVDAPVMRHAQRLLRTYTQHGKNQ